VEGRWGRRKEANTGEAFILKVDRDNMVAFEVNIVRGRAVKFRNESETSEDGVEHVLKMIMEFEFGM
jgi:hypothetical protein